jgi:hypothetical protein
MRCDVGCTPTSFARGLMCFQNHNSSSCSQASLDCAHPLSSCASRATFALADRSTCTHLHAFTHARTHKYKHTHTHAQLFDPTLQFTSHPIFFTATDTLTHMGALHTTLSPSQSNPRPIECQHHYRCSLELTHHRNSCPTVCVSTPLQMPS